MNLAELQKKLTAAARLQPPDERVPYAFEKRVMALIAARRMTERWAAWTRGLWQAAISCVVVALLCGALSWFMPDSTDNGGNKDLSQDFENALLASADQGGSFTSP
ncbi:MAG TPA: hypothetical protein VFF11_15860 [Candidatus Binatia bacterium]|nr:hypothetical protein [Candidatus Binatia bacterium]